MSARGVQRRMDLRKQQKASLEKQIADTRSESNETIINLAKGMYQIASDLRIAKDNINNLSSRLNGVLGMAQSASMRSLAIQKLLVPVGISEDQVTEKANQLLVTDFEAANAKADAELGLVDVEANEEAKPKYTAVASLRLFKEGEEVVALRTIRTRFEVGGADTFPEISQAVIGMKVGDVKRFPLAVQGQTDECELTLFGLRTLKITEEKKDGVVEEEKGAEGQ